MKVTIDIFEVINTKMTIKFVTYTIAIKNLKSMNFLKNYKLPESWNLHAR